MIVKTYQLALIWFSLCTDAWGVLSRVQECTFFLNELHEVSVGTVLELLLVPVIVVLPFSMPAMSLDLVLSVLKVIL